MPVSRGPKGVAQEMRRFKAGKLHSGSKHGPVVTNRKQAIAISLNEAGMSKGKSTKYARGGAVKTTAPKAKGYAYGGSVSCKPVKGTARGMGAAKKGGNYSTF